MKSPFESFHEVWQAQKILDQAFSNAESRSAAIPPSLKPDEKVRRKEIRRIENVTEIIVNRIDNFIASVPNLEELPEFYRKLSNLLVNNDDLKKALGHLNSATPIIKGLAKQYVRQIQGLTNMQEMAKVRVEYFGRCSSVVKKLNSSLTYLEESRKKLKTVPAINLNMPSVVIAGYPNVGKSSMVGKISSAKPEVANYPFTTKQIFIGIYEDKLKSQYFQVIDTPGILDRPMEERNEIEQQAILALNTIASMVLIIIDPTITCGFELDPQVRLYNEIKDHFLAGSTFPLKVVINKIDIATPTEIETVLKKLKIKKEDAILTNAKDGTNVEIIVKYLLDYFRSTHFKR